MCIRARPLWGPVLLRGWLVEKHRWHGIVSVIAAVFAGTALFVGASMASIILSVIVAETLWRS